MYFMYRRQARSQMVDEHALGMGPWAISFNATVVIAAAPTKLK